MSKQISRQFLVEYSYEKNLTVWRVPDADFVDILKTLCRTAGQLQTEGAIPHVEVKELKNPLEP
jgi:hypothetical protein